MPRRAAIAAALIAFGACATPPIVLRPAYRLGEARSYRLEATAFTTSDIGGTVQRERTVLRARSLVQVIAVDGEEATLRLTLTPESFARDGRAVATPPEQSAELVVGADGAVLRILTIGGVAAELVPTDVADLAPVLGSALPPGRMRLGDRWSQSLVAPAAPSPSPGEGQAGRQAGHVAALRVVRGYDCAIVMLSARRPLQRRRELGDQVLSLTGTETSATEIAFAFREGLPVEIHTDSEGSFRVGSGQFSGGTLTIAGSTDLTLLAPQASG